MKVVIPVGALHIGGGCQVLAQLANALTARGHDTEIVIPTGSPIKYKLHCKVTRVRALEKETIPYGDIVLPNFYTTFKPAYEAWPTKCVRWSLGFEPYWVPDKQFALWTYAQGVPIISISHWLDDQIYNHVKQRSIVVNLGVNRHVFHARTSLNHNSRLPKTILYMARDPKAGYELKGFSDFAAAMKIVKKRYPGKFIVKMICTERRLKLPNVPYECCQPKNAREIARLYRNADVFVSTSWFEGFALPPLEAMACGTPVVTTNSGGVMDFSKHRRSAYVVAPKKPKAIARGVIKVLSSRSLSRQLRSGGLAMARRFGNHRFERKMCEELENIYRKRLAIE